LKCIYINELTGKDHFVKGLASMTRREPSKMNLAYQNWPKGTVVTLKWLKELGISSKLANWHVGSHWLESIGAGAFIQPGDKVGWQGAVYAMQMQMNMTVHAGGVSALELLGFSHYVPLGENRKVTLISDKQEHLPSWFRNKDWDAKIEHTNMSLFEKASPETSIKSDCGGFEIWISSAERAVMEQMHLTRNNDDIEQVLQLMEGLNMLRPDVVQALLESCRSAKVKRLFLWGAELLGHDWFNRLDCPRIDLGKGKRRIYKGGAFNQKYQMTVPKKENLPSV
jgi:hypothetical protein